MADSAKHKISTLDIAWAAGFLEGEGWFAEGEWLRIGAAQKNLEPLQKIQSLFGGKITVRKNPNHAGWADGIYWWVLNARRSVQVAMTIYGLMSEKRQRQIKSGLDKWKNGRLLKAHGSNVCALGHAIEGGNIISVGKYKRCRICQNAVRRAYRRSLVSGVKTTNRAYIEFNKG